MEREPPRDENKKKKKRSFISRPKISFSSFSFSLQIFIFQERRK